MEKISTYYHCFMTASNFKGKQSFCCVDPGSSLPLRHNESNTQKSLKTFGSSLKCCHHEVSQTVLIFHGIKSVLSITTLQS